MGIGRLSSRAECNAQTVRYYERVGLVPAPPRTEGGHRQYGEADLSRLLFIRRSRQLGFSIDEIRGLLGLVDAGDGTCGDVREIVDSHLHGVRERIAALRRLETTLVALSSRCEGGPVDECPVIDALARQRAEPS